MTAVSTGDVLGGRYRLTARIAGGGMGEVWRADDEVLGREVAVKILRREYADDSTFLERFRAEARHTAGLAHDGIAAVYDFGEGDTAAGNTGAEDTGAGDTGSGDTAQASPYLVMEHVPGEPLSALIARDGALSPQRTMDVVGQAALALQAAHDAGVVHRDVKPGNILITPAGHVKITDFGIARATNSVPLTQTGAIMGTAHYISPEQASGSSVTPASDLYSLGIVAYECLTGKRPFAGNTPVSVALAQVRDQPPELPETVPVPVRALVMRLLAKDPANRPPDAGEVSEQALALAATLDPSDSTVPDEPPAATRVIPVGEGEVWPAYAPGVEGGATAAALAAPAATSTDTDPGFRLPEPTRLPRWVPYAVALGGLAVLLLLVVRACGADPARTVAASADPTAGRTVEVVAGDYLGRRVGEVRTELRELGLRVAVVRTPGGGTVDTVKDVAPTGVLAEGNLVTVTGVAGEESGDGEESGADESADDEPDEGKGEDKKESEDDKGSGKSKGHGKGDR